MYIILTVIGWVIGLYVAFMLMLAIGFSAGGAANTGNKDLSIMSIASTFLLFYLIYKGFTFFFGSDDIDASQKQNPAVIKTVQYNTPIIEVSSNAPSVKREKVSPIQPQTKQKATPQTTVVKAQKGYFDDAQLLLWIFYSFTFIFYVMWLFKPSKIKRPEKELVKKKLIATMMFKKDTAGLQAWHPAWKPDDQL